VGITTKLAEPKRSRTIWLLRALSVSVVNP
jgi:hypothetical protein